jgi:hypothetical protein
MFVALIKVATWHLHSNGEYAKVNPVPVNNYVGYAGQQDKP